jgi:hypothetical protein
VLELVGQSATLPSYLIDAGSPPPETAGTWHLSCLQSRRVGDQWFRALERSHLGVRQYVPVARTPDWTVIRNPRSGEVLALNRGGGTLPLHGHGPVFGTLTGGRAFRVREAMYWLEWDQPVIAGIQDHLRRTGSVPVLDVAGQLGIDDRLSHRDLLVAGMFRLDEELVPEWRSTVVGAAVEYPVHLPDELAAYYES